MQTSQELDFHLITTSKTNLENLYVDTGLKGLSCTKTFEHQDVKHFQATEIYF